MRNWTNRFAAVTALALMGAFVAPALAQPRKEKREKLKEKAQDRREKVKERREETREKVADKREDVKERRAERREKYKELREKHAEKKRRYDELKEKEEKGELSAGEKAELEKMTTRRKEIKAKHDKIKARRKEWRENRKERIEKAKATILEKHPDIAERPALKAEMQKHGRRMAYLHHSKELAEAEERERLTERIDELIKKEQSRHVAKVKALNAAHTKKGGE